MYIYLFLPDFAWHAQKIVLFRFAELFYEHIMQKPVKTGKYTKIKKQSDVSICHDWIKYGAVIVTKTEKILPIIVKDVLTLLS